MDELRGRYLLSVIGARLNGSLDKHQSVCLPCANDLAIALNTVVGIKDSMVAATAGRIGLQT